MVAFANEGFRPGSSNRVGFGTALKAASALRDPRTMKAGPSPVMLATMRVVELMRWSPRNAEIVVDDDVMRNDGCRAGQ